MTLQEQNNGGSRHRQSAIPLSHNDDSSSRPCSLKDIQKNADSDSEVCLTEHNEKAIISLKKMLQKK